MDQNINYSKFHICSSFFENIISGIRLLKICPHVQVDIIRVFLNFRFSSKKFQSPQKLAKKFTHFTIQFHSKNLTHFTNLNLRDIESNMLPQRTRKPFWLYIYSSKHISVWCRCLGLIKCFTIFRFN